MNTFSVGISGIFGVLAIAFGALLLAAILRNLKTARRYRSEIKSRLSDLRLSRMLSLHHIDRDAYLHSESVLEIEQQMARCTRCAQTSRCDEVLAANREADTAFCVNDGDLQAIKRRLEAA